MRARTTIATVGLSSLLLCGNGAAQETQYAEASRQEERGELTRTTQQTEGEYLTSIIRDATNLTDAFCRYLEETGIADVVNIVRGQSRLGISQNVLTTSMEGFDTDTLDMHITRDENQALCNYEVRIESKLCEFEYRENIVNDYVWVIDADNFRRVTFVSQRTFLQDQEPNQTTPANIAAYEYLARLPRTPDRVYLAAVAEDYVGYEVSILELPNVESCYEVEAMHVNDDDLMDIAVFDPHVYILKDGERKQPSRVYCANEKGHFSNRFCGGKQRELPPHLRIKHPY